MGADDGVGLQEGDGLAELAGEVGVELLGAHGQVREEVADRDAGADCAGGGGLGGEGAQPIKLEQEAWRVFGGIGGGLGADGQFSDRRQCAQGLSAEAEGVGRNLGELLEIAELGGEGPAGNHLEVVLLDAGAVVGDLEHLCPLLEEAHLDLGGTSIEGVLHQLFDCDAEIKDHLTTTNGMDIKTINPLYFNHSTEKKEEA